MHVVAYIISRISLIIYLFNSRLGSIEIQLTLIKINILSVLRIVRKCKYSKKEYALRFCVSCYHLSRTMQKYELKILIYVFVKQFLFKFCTDKMLNYSKISCAKNHLWHAFSRQIIYNLYAYNEIFITIIHYHIFLFYFCR